MVTNIYTSLLKYWRNTLADAARIAIDVEKSIYQADIIIDYDQGLVDQDRAFRLIEDVEKKFNEGKGRKDPKDPDWEFLAQIPVLISLFRISPLPEYAKFYGDQEIIYPYWIRAYMDKQGFLQPPEDDTFPFIPRNYLEPQINQENGYQFSHVDIIDQVFSHPYTGPAEWKDYLIYIKRTFEMITGQQITSFNVRDTHGITWENTIVANETLPNTADGIIQLMDHLINNKEVPPLLASLCNQLEANLKALFTPAEFEISSTRHLGQMGYEYPLSVSQRKSAYYFNQITDGEILAVNGPPGTGKTTLLQSIVAGEVVKSAIKGDAPAIILACSTNNQAVTNIIDSFAKVKPRIGLLYQRWLPELNGFGLYLSSLARGENTDIPTIKKQGKITGSHIEKENITYITSAEQHYLNQYKTYKGITDDITLNEILTDLQSMIKIGQEVIEKGISYWQDYLNIKMLINQLGPVYVEKVYHQSVLNEAALEDIKISILQLESQLADYLDKESIWIRLFSWLKFVKDKRATRIRKIFRECPTSYDGVNFYSIPSIHQFIDQQLQIINKIQKLSQNWNNWRQENHIKGNPPRDDQQMTGNNYFYDELEMGLKYDLFYLATHYWEGRWLIAAREVVEEQATEKMGLNAVKQRWQRFAMLTPCFVSTFYMAPKFFTYSKHIKQINLRNFYESPPLTDFIDLLIVDEAGQVSPEIGAATFALSKKSLVVGDILQIEPVWNVPFKIDHANLLRFGVIAKADDPLLPELANKGFLSSSGSIMKLAQKSSQYHLFPQMERGMMLTEHRRCFNEIISYCNKLAYNGILEPKQGPSTNTILQPMQFIHVDGESRTAGSSRANHQEAASIAGWILENQSTLLQYYQEKELKSAEKENRDPKQLKLGDIIGIVTPFTGQKYTLLRILRQSGIETKGLTIGTVHALQGAERPVILFSSTYGLNDKGKGYFFDTGVNMLNVAVSRAREVFIVFGNKYNFENRSNTPSAKLYNHIYQLKTILSQH